MSNEAEMWTACLTQLLRDIKSKVANGRPTLLIEESAKSLWVREICGYANIDHGWFLDLVQKIKANKPTCYTSD